jgi:hypothetical protein
MVRIVLYPDQFEIDKVVSLLWTVGLWMMNPSLYAISSSTLNLKGLLVNGYGASF